MRDCVSMCVAVCICMYAFCVVYKFVLCTYEFNIIFFSMEVYDVIDRSQLSDALLFLLNGGVFLAPFQNLK